MKGVFWGYESYISNDDTSLKQEWRKFAKISTTNLLAIGKLILWYSKMSSQVGFNQKIRYRILQIHFRWENFFSSYYYLWDKFITFGTLLAITRLVFFRQSTKKVDRHPKLTHTLLDLYIDFSFFETIGHVAFHSWAQQTINKFRINSTKFPNPTVIHPPPPPKWLNFDFLRVTSYLSR